jgi:hypothetical protein
LQGGAEHHVFGDPSNGRVVKVTRPPNFGARGLLTDYLQNILWVNSLFQDDIRFEGVLGGIEGPAIVISQPFIVGRSPTDQEIAQWFAQQGFEQDGYHKWRHRQTGAIIADTHPGNFIVTEDEVMVPIDLQILSPGL